LFILFFIIVDAFTTDQGVSDFYCFILMTFLIVMLLIFPTLRNIFL